MIFFWIVTILATCAAAFQLFTTWALATSAPQQAAGAALAVGIAAIPYIFTRCLEAIMEASWRDESLKNLVGLRDDYKKGVDSLWQQLDRIRATAIAPAPVYPAAPQLPASDATSVASAKVPEIGYCPGCRRVRGTNVAKCLYCGDTAPVRV